MQGKSHSCQSHPARYIAHTTTHQRYCSRHSCPIGSTPFPFPASQRTPDDLPVYRLHTARKSLLGTVCGSQGHSKSICHTRCTVDPYTQAGKAHTVVVGILGGCTGVEHCIPPHGRSHQTSDIHYNKQGDPAMPGSALRLAHPPIYHYPCGIPENGCGHMHSHSHGRSAGRSQGAGCCGFPGPHCHRRTEHRNHAADYRDCLLPCKWQHAGTKHQTCTAGALGELLFPAW